MAHRTYTLEQIKDANHAAGLYWFEPDTMRYFGSRYGATTYGPDSEGRVYFVSRERTGFDPYSSRAYTVRQFDPATAEVSTFGEFLEHPTRTRAIAAAKRAART